MAQTASPARFALARLQGLRASLPARAAGPSAALVSARERIAALQTRSRKLASNASGKGGNIEAALATAAGGAVSGAIKAKMPEVMGFDTRIPVAVGAVGAGLFLVKGRLGGILVNVGAGVGACVISDLIEDMLDGDGASEAA